MTLILTLLTPNSVVQVSDRRVTYLRDGQPVSFEDLSNKAVVYLALAALGYTGSAMVADKRTDVWITETLAPTAGLGDAIAALREAATNEFTHLTHRHQRLAIVMAGWDPVAEGSFAPFCAIVSNFMIREAPSRRGRGAAIGVAHPAERRDHFDAWAFALQRGMGHLLYVAGQAPAQERLTALSRSVRRAVQQGAAPLALVRLLAEEIWQAASRNALVGSSLTAVCVPRSAARTSGPVELFSGPPNPDRITSMYLPGPDAGPIYYMANLAGAGACFIDAAVEPL